MRAMSPAFLAAVKAKVLQPANLVQLSFRSGSANLWTGRGKITWNGTEFDGVGINGSIGSLTEGTSVQSFGTTVSLSGIDPTLYADCLTDLVTGKPAKIYYALLAGATVIDALLLFSGMVDQPTITEGDEDITISLALESKMTNLQRPSRSMYTPADQYRVNPLDSGFNQTPILADEANVWG